MPLADIYVFQEARESWAEPLVNAISKVAGRNYFATYTHNGGSMRLMVLFDRQRFSGGIGFDAQVPGATRFQRHPFIVSLVETATNRQFTLAAVHLAAFQRPDRVAQRQREISVMLSQRQPGVPLLAVGDFNLGCQIGGGGVVNCDTNATYLQQNQMQWAAPIGITPTYCPTAKYPSSVLDFVFASGHTKPWRVTSRHLPAARWCDGTFGKGAHVPIYAEATLPPPCLCSAKA